MNRTPRRTVIVLSAAALCAGVVVSAIAGMHAHGAGPTTSAANSWSRTPSANSWSGTPAANSWSVVPAANSWSRTPSANSWSGTPA